MWLLLLRLLVFIRSLSNLLFPIIFIDLRLFLFDLFLSLRLLIIEFLWLVLELVVRLYFGCNFVDPILVRDALNNS